jgi:large subunit ribosomal protein L4
VEPVVENDMPKVDVWNLKHEKVGELDLDSEVFGAEVNQALLYEAVRHHLAGLRAGTHSTKTRDRVAGSGKKLWKQKGTGRARMGSVRSPIWRHGGTVHGPQPRDYSYRLNKKMISGALRAALSDKVAENKLTVVENLDLGSHKTKDFRALLKSFGAGKTVLVVDADENKNLSLSSRNMTGVEYRHSRQVNAYDLLLHDGLMISQAAVKNLQEALAR